MTNNRDPHAITNDAEEEVIRKFYEIHTTQIAFANVVGLGRVGSFAKEARNSS
jgi:hypothetical protein